MKITTKLIWYHLSRNMDVHWYGIYKDTALKRPEFYSDKKEVQRGRIYLAVADMLPKVLKINSESLIICVGGTPGEEYCKGRFPFMWVEDAHILDVFNKVQEICELYENWYMIMQNIVNTTADIVEIIKMTLPLIENPISVVDRNLRYLARTTMNAYGQIEVKAPREQIGLDEARRLSAGRELRSKMKDPYNRSETEMCMNLFLNGQYEGMILIQRTEREFWTTDCELMYCLAEAIENCMQKQVRVLSSHSATKKSIVRDFLEGTPVSDFRLNQVLEQENDRKCIGRNLERYVCICLGTLHSKGKELPLEYICETLEASTQGCMAFVVQDSVVGVLDLQKYTKNPKQLEQDMLHYLQEYGYNAGVSESFYNLREVRNYYMQACKALQTGLYLKNSERIYKFRDYVIDFVLLNSVDEVPVEYLCPQGLLKLREYDKTADVSYWQTLKTYLDNGLNASQTAKDLFLHRNTLQERLKRIYKLLNMDIHDSEQQLQIRMAMKLLELTDGYTVQTEGRSDLQASNL